MTSGGRTCTFGAREGFEDDVGTNVPDPFRDPFNFLLNNFDFFSDLLNLLRDVVDSKRNVQLVGDLWLARKYRTKSVRLRRTLPLNNSMAQFRSSVHFLNSPAYHFVETKVRILSRFRFEWTIVWILVTVLLIFSRVLLLDRRI